ncbi:DUF3994 domain-containing protein [Bacillus sp. DNRA2]|uniref:DUF7018 domain-containing (lipo)protein n=1 Tax=Bacillus sp. DNRA2 TaxID=2723053 RepID=UPI00145DE549|nr:DUF3994 domain-containing protein [Bacillus sp. DNRA2]NMD72671.1 DUF3994 domain-containing protein [Bacillus sp. DNRA2]
MKLKVLLVLLLTATSLLGCNGLPVQVDKTEKVKVASVKVSKEEYEKKIKALGKKLNKAFLEMNKVVKLDPDVKGRNQKILDSLDGIREIVNEYRSYKAPKEYEDIQALFMKATDHYNKMLDLMEKAVEKQDEEIWQTANSSLKKGDEYWIQANQTLLDRTTTLGDGTITAEDLKNLDKAAGIDRDAVKRNISDDGQELIGKWGFEGSTPSIVLNADGTYEGYKDGTYPSRDNAYFGTWKYDKETQVIHFTNDQSFLGGKETESRPTMDMNVQNFQDGKMYLMDIESFAEFHFVKMGKATASTKASAKSSLASSKKADNQALLQKEWIREDGDFSRILKLDKSNGITVTNRNNATGVSTYWSGQYTFDKKTSTIHIQVTKSEDPDITLGTFDMKVLTVTEDQLDIEVGSRTFHYNLNAQ